MFKCLGPINNVSKSGSVTPLATLVRSPLATERKTSVQEAHAIHHICRLSNLQCSPYQSCWLIDAWASVHLEVFARVAYLHDTVISRSTFAAGWCYKARRRCFVRHGQGFRLTIHALGRRNSAAPPGRHRFAASPLDAYLCRTTPLAWSHQDNKVKECQFIVYSLYSRVLPQFVPLEANYLKEISFTDWPQRQSFHVWVRTVIFPAKKSCWWN